MWWKLVTILSFFGGQNQFIYRLNQLIIYRLWVWIALSSSFAKHAPVIQQREVQNLATHFTFIYPNNQKIASITALQDQRRKKNDNCSYNASVS